MTDTTEGNGGVAESSRAMNLQLEEFSKIFHQHSGKQQDDDGDSSTGESDELNDGGTDEESGQPESSKLKLKSKPKTLEALAEALGLKDAAELYDIEIPSGLKQGQAFKLGALKDLAKQHGDLEMRALKLDSDRRAFERERVEAEQHIRELMRALPADAVDPKAMTKLRAKLEERHGRERERVLEVIPEWSEEPTRLAELRSMVDYLKGYDLPETFLMEHFDHRVMRLIRDAWRTAETVKAALAKVTERKDSAHGRSTRRDSTARKSQPQAAGTVNRGLRQFQEAIHNAAKR